MMDFDTHGEAGSSTPGPNGRLRATTTAELRQSAFESKATQSTNWRDSFEEVGVESPVGVSNSVSI